MLTDIEQRKIRRLDDLDISNLNDYWNQYFAFRENSPDLHQLIEKQLFEQIEIARTLDRPYIDSQQCISEILTRLGQAGTFHRQFHEQFPYFHAHHLLGMQLYYMMLGVCDLWIFTFTKHPNHHFPHATYFKPND